MQDMIAGHIKRAEARLAAGPVRGRALADEGLSLLRRLVRYYERPGQVRPPDLEKQVCRGLLLLGEGGIYD